MYLMNKCKCAECNNTVLSEINADGEICENGDYCFNHHPNRNELAVKIYNYIYTHDTIIGLNASGLVFSGINLSNKKFYGCNFQHCFFIGIRSENLMCRISTFNYSLFTDCNLLKSNIQFTSFAGSRLIHVLFSGSELKSNNFTGVTALQTSFDDSDLYKSHFVNAYLSGSSFRNCNIKKAIFYAATLKNTSFRMSNTKEAIFDKNGTQLSEEVDNDVIL